MTLVERWQGRRYRRRYGLRSRNGALDAALAAMREQPEQFDTPGGRAYLANLRKLAGQDPAGCSAGVGGGELCGLSDGHPGPHAAL